MIAAAKDIDRFWDRVVRDPETDCWLWQGSLVRGYGQFSVDGHGLRAHRFSYELLSGPIPEGLTLDHLCRERSCVNPAHLEPVENRTNVLRGIGPSAKHARQTHCKRGHEYTPENTRMRAGGRWRECRTCGDEKMREWKEARRSSGFAEFNTFLKRPDHHPDKPDRWYAVVRITNDGTPKVVGYVTDLPKLTSSEKEKA